MKPNTLIFPLIVSFTLSGCVVGAAADLAATTVLTAGKLAVKGTGALINAAIPDGDDEKKEKKKSRKEKRKEKAAEQPTYSRPQNSPYPYQPNTPVVYQTNHPAQTTPQPRYITIDEYGNAHETTAPYSIRRPSYMIEQEY
ncbi:NF038104 family lipoprotein [Neisseria yangbaofengii]|uniref:NF038104 family lipoprotein n=1 Tax=Neisseria yangbaofengii TaxID=2709396 RepID=UPI00280B17BD|nr:NF038104 family lipoprotein [Neisseria yangbaofengii]